MPPVHFTTVQPGQTLMLQIATLFVFIAVTWFVIQLQRILQRHITERAAPWEFEEARRIRIRRENTAFRLFEPLIDELSESKLLSSVVRPDKVNRALTSGGSPLPWKPDEFVATKFMEGILVAVPIAFLLTGFVDLSSNLSVVFLVIAIYLTQAVRSLDRVARERVEEIEIRLPFGIDLIALMMQAGAGFTESVETLVADAKDHPLGEEFSRVLTDIRAGQPLNEALNNLQSRLNSPDINDMVFAIHKATELGTPLSDIFLSMADQIRLKRSQWAEKAAGKAQAMISFPALVVMCSCLLIIIGPFVLSAIEQPLL